MNRLLLVGALVAVVVIASLGVYLALSFPKQSTGFLSDSISTKNDTLGLSLTLKLNSTSIHPSQRLAIYITLLNNLPTNNNLTVASHWKVHGFPVALWSPCFIQQFGEPNEPVEFVAVKGNYSLGMLETLSANTSIGYGGCHEFSIIQHLVFQPLSDRANLTGFYCAARCYQSPISYTNSLSSNFTVNGYWTYPLNRTDGLTRIHGCYSNVPTACYNYQYPEVAPIAQHLFTAGLYTLVVSDEWGQTVILRFVVSL